MQGGPGPAAGTRAFVCSTSGANTEELGSELSEHCRSQLRAASSCIGLATWGPGRTKAAVVMPCFHAGIRVSPFRLFTALHLKHRDGF